MKMKTKKVYVCNNCGSTLPKWSGQCPDCKEWNTMEEDVVISGNSNSAAIKEPSTFESFSLDNKEADFARISTNFEEFDRVLGGGIVPGSVILLGGEPGIGKSTIILQLAGQLSKKNNIGTAYVTGEESARQVQLRASRLEVGDSKAKLLSATNLEEILASLETIKHEIKLVVIDSIQTVYSSLIPSAPGTVSQIRHASNEFINFAKKNNIIFVLVGHVTKEGNIAGPKLLEHMVDVVLYFEGDTMHDYRILRGIKNRYGSINEIGVFEMQLAGLVEVTNPSELFMLQRPHNVTGTAIFATMQGTRPLLVEVQALIAPSNMATPRRSVVGWDNNRLSMILAVLAVRYGLNLSNYEVYLSVAGGLKINEPAADLAVAAAIISASSNTPLPDKSVYFGEIGLTGEIRRVPQTESRVREAIKLGFTNIYCSTELKSEELNKHIKQVVHIKQI